LLSTPLTACLVVIGKYVPQMEFIEVLLGDEPPLPVGTRLYQRLLAMDIGEATELAMATARTMSLEELYDTVFIPALASAERDARHDRVHQDRIIAIRAGMKTLIDQTLEREMQEIAAKDPNAEPAALFKKPGDPEPHRVHLPADCKLNVLCLPANDEGDELCGVMLARLLELRGYCVFPVTPDSLASEMVDAVEQKEAHAVVISALPPGALHHATYLLKRLRGKYDGAPIIMGLWTVKGDVRRWRNRIDPSPNTRYATDLRSAMEQIQQFSQKILIANSKA
ncbi:MAG: hypothetical protein JO353_03095, partial [Phycisphaerae bacterium]|nr:hypothetical protein [Phycisphaerae bacterium]